MAVEIERKLKGTAHKLIRKPNTSGKSAILKHFSLICNERENCEERENSNRSHSRRSILIFVQHYDVCIFNSIGVYNFIFYLLNYIWSLFSQKTETHINVMMKKQ